MSERSEIHILGGGPTGLALAHGLATGKKRSRFTVYERADQLGGLAQSVKWKTYGSHDLGPHKIFTLDLNLQNRVESLLQPEEWLTREKKSSIYMRGHYLPYPPSPFSLASVYGIPRFLKMVVGYALAQLKNIFRSNNARTFEEDVETRVGNGLYVGLFKPIAEKLWGHPSQLDVKLSKGRVQTPNPIEVIGRLLGLIKTSQFEALNFRYPVGGLQKLWDSIASQTMETGEFLTGTELVQVHHENDLVKRLEFKCRGGDPLIVDIKDRDMVFSTLPLEVLAKSMTPKLPAEILKKIENLSILNDLLLVFLKVPEASLIKDSWIFIPDPEIVFHRLSEQESFDPNMTPQGSIVCCEIMSHSERPFLEKSDEELIKACLTGLQKMGIQVSQIEDSKVVRLRRSYPVFRPGFESNLSSVIAYFDKFKNLKTIGRQGAFNYIGTLDAMDIGYGTARWIDSMNENAWQQERKRTEHYPVLD